MGALDDRPFGTTRSYWLQRRKALSAHFNQLMMETGIPLQSIYLFYTQDHRSQLLIGSVMTHPSISDQRSLQHAIMCIAKASLQMCIVVKGCSLWQEIQRL